MIWHEDAHQQYKKADLIATDWRICYNWANKKPMWKQKKQIIIILLFSLFLLAPVAASAAGLVPCGGPNNGEKPCTFQDMFILVARATNFLIEWAGVFAVYQIIFNSFGVIWHLGEEESITQYRKSLSNAIVGFVMVMMAFVFINTTVNIILSSKCSFDLTNPLNYIEINNQCTK